MKTNSEPSPIRARWYAETLRAKMDRPFVHILFGARQTGKSTLLNGLLPPDALRIDLADPGERALHLAHPDEFRRMCQALPPKPSPRYVFVDEAQNVPAIFDSVQSLYDGEKRRWRFVLCGSSARRLRRSGANLLPGRAFFHHLYPLVMSEQPPADESAARGESPLPLPWRGKEPPSATFPSWPIEQRIAYGALPGVVLAEPEDRADILKGFATAYLEEEIRREALVRDWAAFLRFLSLAAAESGRVLNYTAIARETGLSLPTVKSHYQLLEDMFVGFALPAFSGSSRKNLLSTPRFLFFDLGVRHAAAGLTPGEDTARAQAGALFEQWVGLELWRRLQYRGEGRLHYLRTEDGAEVDYVVETERRLIPVEVKWSEHPAIHDARHLRAFLKEHSTRADHAYLVCRCRRPMRLAPDITAIPWHDL